MRRAYPFCVAISFLFLNLTHKSHTVLEADLIGSSHFSGGGIAHAVEYLMEYIDLFLTQRVFKGNTELVEIVRKLIGGASEKKSVKNQSTVIK
jgi:hypothetical protein